MSYEYTIPWSWGHTVSTDGFGPQWFLVSEVRAMRLESTFTREVRDETGLFSTLCIKILYYLPLSWGVSSAASADAYHKNKHDAEQDGNIFSECFMQSEILLKDVSQTKSWNRVLVKWMLISVHSYIATKYSVILPCRPGVFQPALCISAVGGWAQFDVSSI